MKEGGFKDIEDQYIKLIQEQKYVYQKGYVFLIPSFLPSLLPSLPPVICVIVWGRI